MRSSPLSFRVPTLGSSIWRNKRDTGEKRKT
jgi:hypothetical protein